MKRISTILIAMAVLCSAAYSQVQTRSFTDKVTGGSLTVTNNAEEGSAFELKRVEFKIDSATFTNAFAIVQNRKFQLDDVAYDDVVTNIITDVVTTNTSYYSGGSATFAHTNTIATTTNDTSVQVYDGDDFGWGLTFEEEDIQTFSFTYTNTIYLIRVYDVYPRP